MLEIKNLSIAFRRYGGGIFNRVDMEAVSGLSLSVRKGECVAIVGSSGAGKSVFAHAVLGILPRNTRVSGEILFKGTLLDDARIRQIRGKEIAFIPQSVNFLDPLIRVKNQIRRAATLAGYPTSEAKERTDAALCRFGLDGVASTFFPYQLSGGMARRVLTAIATVTNADCIIADEPTTGLDRELIGESLSCLKNISDENKSVIIITHDIEAAVSAADRIAVFYGGTIVEIAQPVDFFTGANLRHPYSRDLFTSLPQNGFIVNGGNGKASSPSGGCVFYSQCGGSTHVCATARPEMKEKNNGHVWCHNA